MITNPEITVITPSYNRAHTLKRAYQSLVNQTFKNFKWLVMDDGSTDQTATLIKELQKENQVSIEYHYHENRHKFITVFKGIEKIRSEYFVFLDSDDELLPNALEVYITAARNLTNPEEFISINALDVYPDGRLVSDPFPEELKSGTILEMRQKYKVRGDISVMIFTKKYQEYLSRFDYNYFDRRCYIPQNVFFSIYDADGLKSLFLNEKVLQVNIDPEDNASVTSTRDSGKNLFGLREGYRANLNNYRNQLFSYPSYLLRQLVGYLHYARLTNSGIISTIADITYWPYKFFVIMLLPMVWLLTTIGILKRPGSKQKH